MSHDLIKRKVAVMKFTNFYCLWTLFVSYLCFKILFLLAKVIGSSYYCIYILHSKKNMTVTYISHDMNLIMKPVFGSSIQPHVTNGLLVLTEYYKCLDRRAVEINSIPSQRLISRIILNNMANFFRDSCQRCRNSHLKF